MRIITFSLVVLFAVLVTVGCKNEKPPMINGKTVLTNAQYATLISKMNEGEANETKKINAEAALKGSAFATGAHLYKNQDYTRAAVEFERAVKDDPTNSKAWYMLGSCYEHTGNMNRAQTAFKRSYDIMVEQGYIRNSREML